MKEAALANYFAEGASWDQDRIAQSRRVTRVAFGVAAAGWTCVMLMSAALIQLTPLKRTEPYLVRVDNTSGVVDVVPVYAGKATLPEAVSRYFLTHYVTVCERFAFATAESDYEECGAFHTPARNRYWSTLWARTNPASPLNLYRDGSIVRAEVSAVSFFERASGLSDLAQVRYAKIRKISGGAAEEVTHWISTIQYTFAEPAADPKVRRWNPLAFKVIEFHTEPEVVTEQTAVPTVARAASAPTSGGGRLR
jgi:type IV secretion system protein VirB8